MKRSFAIVVLICVLYGCELIDISKRHTVKHINLTQETPIGVVYLFMAEIDSNNAKGASVLLAKDNGQLLLAYEKYDKYEEMQRLKRVMKFNPVTLVRFDTISDIKMKVKMEIDYFKNYNFITERINNNWYIINYDSSN